MPHADFQWGKNNKMLQSNTTSYIHFYTNDSYKQSVVIKTNFFWKIQLYFVASSVENTAYKMTAVLKTLMESCKHLSNYFLFIKMKFIEKIIERLL